MSLRHLLKQGGFSTQLLGKRSVAIRPSTARFFSDNVPRTPDAAGADPLGTTGIPTESHSLRENLMSAQASAEASASMAEDLVPKIIIFGGRGFVGSHICQEALTTGLKVVGISKSGMPPMSKESWVDQVEWVRGDALEPQSYLRHLSGAVAAISCIGGFGNNAAMLKVNGTANVTFIEAAASAGVPRLVFISAHMPNIPGLEMVLGGYVKGKAQAEEAVLRCFPDSGVILRPSVVYGSRAVTTSLSLPLQYAFQPLEYALSFAPTKQLAGIPVLGAVTTPPRSVQAVARAAVRAATDPTVPAGVMDVWAIAEYN